MGWMSVTLLVQRVDFGGSQASECLDQSSRDSGDIDLVRRVRFVTEDHVFDSQDTGGMERLLSSHFGQALLRQREWIR